MGRLVLGRRRLHCASTFTSNVLATLDLLTSARMVGVRPAAACPTPAATAIACSAANGNPPSLPDVLLANPLIARPASSNLGAVSLPPNPKPSCPQLITGLTCVLTSASFAGAALGFSSSSLFCW
jgi:hypothetical protein